LLAPALSYLVSFRFFLFRVACACAEVLACWEIPGGLASIGVAAGVRGVWVGLLGRENSDLVRLRWISMGNWGRTVLASAIPRLLPSMGWISLCVPLQCNGDLWTWPADCPVEQMCTRWLSCAPGIHSFWLVMQISGSV
jgi:hypothetical protein